MLKDFLLFIFLPIKYFRIRRERQDAFAKKNAERNRKIEENFVKMRTLRNAVMAKAHGINVVDGIIENVEDVGDGFIVSTTATGSRVINLVPESLVKNACDKLLRYQSTIQNITGHRLKILAAMPDFEMPELIDCSPLPKIPDIPAMEIPEIDFSKFQMEIPEIDFSKFHLPISPLDMRWLCSMRFKACPPCL